VGVLVNNPKILILILILCVVRKEGTLRTLSTTQINKVTKKKFLYFVTIFGAVSGFGMISLLTVRF
jgi:hypothetical protein